MITRTVLTGLLAGSAAGVVLTVFYLLAIQPMILAAEVHELGPARASQGMTAMRMVNTLLFNVLAGVGFGLVLAALFVMRGRPVGIRDGALWGLAGFAAVTLAPAIGLPPELPGMVAAPLVERQLWWVLTALTTAAGLGLLALSGRRALRAAGIVLIAAPHIVGAPHPADAAGAVPPELAARFAVISLASMAAFWGVLGACAGYVFDYLAEQHSEGTGTA